MITTRNIDYLRHNDSDFAIGMCLTHLKALPDKRVMIT